jgi:transcriptional regulator with XRE-family HTH domain
MSKPPVVVSTALGALGEDVATSSRLRGLTAAEIADRAGVTRQSVDRLESGHDVGTGTLLRAARALGVMAEERGYETRAAGCFGSGLIVGTLGCVCRSA